MTTSNDQASNDTANTDVDEITSDDNPFRESAATVVDEVTAVPDEEEDDVSGNTNDSINAPLDELKDIGVLKSMVTRLRHENGNHRKRNKDLEGENAVLKAEKVKRLNSVKDATERAERAEARAKSYVIKLAAEEYDVDEDFIDFLDGNSDEEIYEKASKLAKTKMRKPAYELPDTLDPFAKRGRSVSKQRKDAGGEFVRDFFS